jgi:hypothetical protein
MLKRKNIIFMRLLVRMIGISSEDFLLVEWRWGFGRFFAENWGFEVEIPRISGFSQSIE